MRLLLSFVYLEGEVKVERLYREKRELLATEVCWLLIAEKEERERKGGRDRNKKRNIERISHQVC